MIFNLDNSLFILYIPRYIDKSRQTFLKKYKMTLSKQEILQHKQSAI